jgi:hypothetical protein
MTKRKKTLDFKNITKIIARMVYEIQGSGKDQPEMVGLKEAVGTLEETIQFEVDKVRKEAKEQALECVSEVEEFTHNNVQGERPSWCCGGHP